MTRLFADRRGAALMEMAFALPLLLILVMGGAELTNQIIVRKQMSQIAIMVADNASRMGDDVVLGAKPVSEREINDVLLGAEIESAKLKLGDHGRVILSSLEQNESGGQWIHWQRCYGRKTNVHPAYSEGTGRTGTAFEGIRAGSTVLRAARGDAIMFVEIAYDYQPIVPIAFRGNGVSEIRATAAMNVRDKRDLSGVQPYAGSTPASCA